RLPFSLAPEELEHWRRELRRLVLKIRIEAGGQLDQMVSHGDSLDLHAAGLDRNWAPPSLRVGDRVLAWSELAREWDHSQGRLVVLGHAGYGKTVAALNLVSHINARTEPGSMVAELFSLSEWNVGPVKRGASDLSAWIARELARTTGLPQDVASQLVSEGVVLPILDGLDEVPMWTRRACVDAISAYTRRTAPHRPFVVTCRPDEYAPLAPDWVSADQHIELIGLEPHQVMSILDTQMVRRQGWGAVRQAFADDNTTLTELFRSPLYLTTALRAYRRGNPAELISLTVDEAKRRIWVNRPVVRGDSWPWKIKDGVHAFRTHSWEADDASVFSGGEAGGGEDGPLVAG
ncbi:MAG: NACHT domain-containing protein, partial [Solirubrobacteraceae bacterium]